jgi:serine/threonine-protein kinase
MANNDKNAKSSTPPPTRMPKKIKSYEVIQVLGRGGMGEVYLAKHDMLERQVAIKRYSPIPGGKDDEKNTERFLREGQALAKIQHHGIVSIHDMFEYRDNMYMVLEYVDGYHVGELLSKGPLPLDISCIIGIKLAEALAYAHFHQILHRDIKASNVMVSKKGQVKLMDFGIARGEVLAKITQTGLIVGTPMYMAPEVLSGQEPSELSDLYGIGALMYQCLTGRKLYSHTSGTNMYAAIMAGKYIPIQKVVKGVPRQLRNIVHQCLASKPEKRYSSVSEFRQTLDLFMASNSIWVNPAEYLADFIKDIELPIDIKVENQEKSVEISDFDISELRVESGIIHRSSRKMVRRLTIFFVFATMILGLVWVVWGSYKLGWLAPILNAFGIEI